MTMMKIMNSGYNSKERLEKVVEILSQGTMDLIKDTEYRYTQASLMGLSSDKIATVEISLKKGDRHFGVSKTISMSPICKLDPGNVAISVDADEDIKDLVDVACLFGF